MEDRTGQQYTTSQIALKQAYLRENVPSHKHDDFGQFCQNIVGNLDIDSWTLAFVKELVEKFNVLEKQKQNMLKKRQNQSFHIYQTGNAKQIGKLAEQIREQKNKQPISYSPNNETKINENHKHKESALDMLDSIFQNDLKQAENKEQFTTNKYDKSFFQSNRFWNLPVEDQLHEKQNYDKNQFGTIKPQNFQKIFQTGTGIVIESNKKQNKNQIKQKILEEIINEDDNHQQKQKYSKNEQNQNRVDKNKKDKSGTIKLISVSQVKPVKIPYEGEPQIKSTFKTSVACFKAFERHALSPKNLKVTIEDHEIIHRSFFADYVMYHLKVHPSNIICKRNIQDFIKLKNNLQYVYPGIKMPYLSKLGWLESETSIEHINKQKKYLQYFLQDLIDHVELRNSRLLEDFLTLKDHKQIKRKFEEYQKIKKISAIEQLCLLEGEVKVEINEDLRVYNEHLQKFVDQTTNFLEKKQKILGDIKDCYDSIVLNFQKLYDCTEQMQNWIKQFNKKVRLNEIESFCDSLDKILAYSNQSFDFNQEESNLIDKTWLPFLRWQQENLTELSKVNNIQIYLTKQYLKRKDQQKNNDNLQYLSERLKDYKLDILEESKNITVLKYQCGYINQLMANEAKHYYDCLAHKFSKVIQDTCWKKLKKMSEGIDVFTSLINA